MFRLRWTANGRDELRALGPEEVRIGRGSENEVVLPDFSVSRRHAAIRREPEGWVVADLMSTNGIQVNRIQTKRALLRPGDKVKVGIFELELEEVTEPAAGGLNLPTAGVPQLSVGTATIVRSIADFNAAYGLDDRAPGAPSSGSTEKRRDLEQAYSSKIFGFMTRLARLLIQSDSVDNVLSRVMEMAFEALPVDRGFILLRDEATGQI